MTNTSILRALGIGATGLSFIAAPFLALASGNDFRPHSVGSPLEVMISDDNTVTVRGAKVTDVDGTVVTAETLWGASRLTWTIRTNADTELIRASGASAKVADVTAGDYVSFSGRIDTSQPPFTVSASSLKDWTLPDRFAVYQGTIQSIDDAKHTFVLESEKGAVTVKAGSNTSYAKGGLESFTGLSAGDTVLAFGSFDARAKVLTATKVNMLQKVLTHGGNQKVAVASWLGRILPQFFGK